MTIEVSPASTDRKLESIIYCSTTMQRVMRQVKQFAKQDAIVLIEGSTGTGKEVIARAIHSLSTRRDKPLEVFSRPRDANSLIEDELFGHDRGAFTDARESRKGKIERADGGTFFLDDINDMPLHVQDKLLRTMETGEIEHLGGKKSFKVDIRVIAATKFNLEEMVEAGKFREDLFYRLSVLRIQLPLLRNRVGDVPLLARHFIGDRQFTIAPHVMKAMEEYPWPGNVRELKNAIERAIGKAEWISLKLEDLIPSYRNPRSSHLGSERHPGKNLWLKLYRSYKPLSSPVGMA